MEKDCVTEYSRKSFWKRFDVYCEPRSLWKIRPGEGVRCSYANLKVPVISWVLFFLETLISDDQTGIQVNDHTDIVVSFIQFETGDITDPCVVWLRYLKLLLNHISLRFVPLQPILL